MLNYVREFVWIFFRAICLAQKKINKNPHGIILRVRHKASILCRRWKVKTSRALTGEIEHSAALARVLQGSLFEDGI